MRILAFQVFDGVTETFRLEVGVEWYCHSASFHNAVIADYVLDTVLHEEGNAVTFLGTDGYEVVGKVVSSRVDLGVGGADLAVDDGDLVGVKSGTPFEEMVDKRHGWINGNDGSK